MKVVAILGGLGSQMFKYAFFRLVKENNSEPCYIDTLSYKCSEVWNGYELERIFGIKENKLDDIVVKEDLIGIESDYITHVLKLLAKHSPEKKIKWFINGKFHCATCDELIQTIKNEKNSNSLLQKIQWGIKYYSFSFRKNINKYPENYLNLEGNVWYGEFNHSSNEYIEDKKTLMSVFQFPPFLNDKNIKTSQEMSIQESVAVSVRRSDHMYDNGILFLNGYYKKAVKKIKAVVKNPVFYVFSEDMEWCSNHLDKLGLDKEQVIFVDWNRKQDSYRDMQLMTYCKHNILVKSSFGWWGYYLSTRDSKIVCAPKGCWTDVSYHF